MKHLFRKLTQPRQLFSDSCSDILSTRTEKMISPTHGTMFIAIPAARPARSATRPMTQGIRIAPLDAAGSMMPMLVTLVILPALATAVGFMPAIANAKANSSRIAAGWLSARIRST